MNTPYLAEKEPPIIHAPAHNNTHKGGKSISPFPPFPTSLLSLCVCVCVYYINQPDGITYFYCVLNLLSLALSLCSLRKSLLYARGDGWDNQKKKKKKGARKKRRFLI